MATLSAVVVVQAGIDQSLAAAAGGGDEFVNDGNKILVVANGDASPHTVTVDSPNADNFGVTDAAHDMVKAVPAGETHYFGPFSKRQFNDSAGKCQITYSAVTSITVGVLEFVGAFLGRNE